MNRLSRKSDVENRTEIEPSQCPVCGNEHYFRDSLLCFDCAGPEVRICRMADINKRTGNHSIHNLVEIIKEKTQQVSDQREIQKYFDLLNAEIRKMEIMQRKLAVALDALHWANNFINMTLPDEFSHPALHKCYIKYIEHVNIIARMEGGIID